MKIGGRTWMAMVLMAISAAVIVTAIQWPFKAALFPMTIAVFVLAVAGIEVFIGLFTKQTAKESSTLDFKLASAEDMNIDQATVRRRVIRVWLWMGLFLAMILLFGFIIAIPLFFIVFLRVHAKEGWKMIIILTVSAWVFFYVLFIKVLHTPFPEGWLQQGFQFFLK